MVTSLKQGKEKKKKGGWINPISLGLFFLIISTVVSSMIGKSPIIEKIAEKTYFQSKDFQDMLVELTFYLKQKKLDLIYGQDNTTLKENGKFESIKNLIYIISKDDKTIKNDSVNSIPILKRNSDNYYHITFYDENSNSVHSNLKIYERYISDKLTQTIKLGRMGETNSLKEVDYSGIEVYYFTGINTLKEGDFIYDNIKNQEDIERIKMTLYIHLAVLMLWAVIVLVGAIKRTYQNQIWQLPRKVPVELKVLGLLILGSVTLIFYNKLRYQNSLLYACLYGNLLLKIRLITTLLMCISSWYIVDFVDIIRKDYKQKRLLNEQIKQEHREVNKIHHKIGIDFKKPYQFKVVIYNLVHIAILWYYAYWCYNWWGIHMQLLLVLLSIAFMLELFVLYKFQELTNYMSHIKDQKPHVNMMIKIVMILVRLAFYGLTLFSFYWTSYDVSYRDYAVLISNLLIVTILGLAVMFWSLKVVEDYRKLYLYVNDMTEGKEGINVLEPISNASYDLEIPLTSIIHYVDLLKNEDLTEDEFKEYVSILEQKSRRLKVLVEDQFETSKTASDHLELNEEKLDLVSLLKQSLLEVEEKIEASNLQFKVIVPEEKVYCLLDKQRTYRIFENLLNNILKYAAPYSRVYINCEQKNGLVNVTFRNTSANEINFTGVEMMERFKKEDQSRNTDGSGLAIAKNLIELQGGTLELVIDGDLFKAIVTFPVEVNLNKVVNI